MNLSLTLFADHLRSRFGFWAHQAKAWAARVTLTLASVLTRAAIFLKAHMESAERAFMDAVFTRKMAIRRLFLEDPRNPRSGYTRDGLTLLTYLSRHAAVLSAEPSTDPVALGKAEGKRELLALIWQELFAELPDFARVLAEEERRRAEEIVPA